MSNNLHSFFFSAAVFVFLCSVAGELSAKPNVVLILTDNQGYHELGCHGHKSVKTPNIDALAAQSIDFTNFHAPPYCSPSRGLLLTGRYALRLGIHNTIGGVSILHQRETTLANRLGDAGYTSGIFGKWHLGMSYPHMPRHRGFDQAFIHGGGGIGQLEDYYGNSHIDATYWHNGKIAATKGFSTDVLFAKAMEFIEANQKEPFFCFISTPATHKPWQAHPEIEKRIIDRDGRVPDLALLSMIENIDDNVGKVLKRIDDLGLRENTLVIFATDQGMSNRGAPVDSAENPPSGKFDGRHHVFCMMRYPPLTKQPVRNDALTGMVDVTPTILDLCGAPVPVKLDGRSLRPLLAGAKRWTDDRKLIIQCPRGRNRQKWKNAVVKTQRWRLIDDKLYDIDNNNAEVAASHPEVAQRLGEHYEEFWNSLPTEDAILTRHPIGPRETRLNGMDWYQGGSPWNRGHFGRKQNGEWAVHVDKEARYRFEVRRFPREAEKPIGGKLASLRIGERSKSKPISKDTDHVVFEMNVPPGDYDLKATFTDDKGEWGAYFVYVSMLSR